MSKTPGINGMDPQARYNDKGQVVSAKWRNNWKPGWCSVCSKCDAFPRCCGDCMLLNGKRTEYVRKGDG